MMILLTFLVTSVSCFCGGMACGVWYIRWRDPQVGWMSPNEDGTWTCELVGWPSGRHWSAVRRTQLVALLEQLKENHT